MRKRVIYGLLIVALALAVIGVVWQSAFNPGSVRPASVTQTVIFWAILILIFLLIVTLGFILFREGLKLYVERQKQREGSHIKTKLVLGALLLSTVPVFFMCAFTYGLTNRNLSGWFREPKSHEIDAFKDVAKALEKEMRDETAAQTELLAAQPEVLRLLDGAPLPAGFLEHFCNRNELRSAAIYLEPGHRLAASWGPYAAKLPTDSVQFAWTVWEGNRQAGSVVLTATTPGDIEQKKQDIRAQASEWQEMWDAWKQVRTIYMLLLGLITLFILFLGVWVALFMAKQISVPIGALLDAAGEVRKGNLGHRVAVRATDELGDLVRAFNRMIEELESSNKELDRRRRFTEAILESIPTGVISVGPDGAIRRVNGALGNIFPAERVAAANRLEDLFTRDDAAEIRYMMKRARRTGAASRQMEMVTDRRTLHLAVTVSAIEEKLTSGFVVVLEDTSELLRAQKSAAWHEVARRVAHEIKNPLTPIALSAERISRQLDKMQLPPATQRIVAECAATISRSVESVKTLVDEFSQFARFPTIQPAPCDLNEVVTEALVVFRGRLEGIAIHTSFAEGLAPVNLDREQFQRVVINLVDNAAEAMQDSLVRQLEIATQGGPADTVELVVADSGPGVSQDDKEKLFLPYFSTKNRGTGLGLAIVNHIVAEHHGTIRVEDNHPAGARFTVEIPAIVESDAPEPDVTPGAAPEVEPQPVLKP